MRKIAFLFILSLGLLSCQQDKTAFVDNTKIMEGFDKLKETENQLTLEEEGLKAKMDAMIAQSSYQELVQEYQAKQGKMTKSKEEELYNEIMQIQQSLSQQQQMMTQQFQQKRTEQMDSLVNSVKDFIKTYGKDNGYTYIYGSNESGNILYGKEELDLTDEIIKSLNEKYKVESEDTDDSEQNEEATQEASSDSKATE